MKRWRRFFQWIFFRGFNNPEPVLPVYSLHSPAPDMDVLRHQLVSFYQEAVMGDIYLLAFSPDYSQIVEMLRTEGWLVEMTVGWDGQIMYEILPKTTSVDLRFLRLS